MVVGTAMNLLVQSVTAFLMQIIYGSRAQSRDSAWSH